MQIDVIDKLKFLESSQKKYIKDTVKKIIIFLQLPKEAELCVSFINDIEMRKLNRNYRNIDRTTDILSFPQNMESGNNILGDLVISYETAFRHSEKYKLTIDEEIKKLLVHGILHLLGHDHKKKNEASIMRENENEILLSLK
ncbi:MAG: rRNA maturation RNase YbeY [Thermodesulfobacteriota bacterium]